MYLAYAATTIPSTIVTSSEAIPVSVTVKKSNAEDEPNTSISK